MNTPKKQEIVVVGGGTGGHIFPVKTLIEYLDKNGYFDRELDTIFWLGLSNSLEQKVCQSLCLDRVKFVSIASGKRRREGTVISFFRNVKDFAMLLRGVIICLKFFLTHPKVSKIFCKGGFVSLPVVLAGFILRKKIIVHESDTVSGLANKICSRFATKTFTGFEGVIKNAQPIGQIISPELLASSDPKIEIDTNRQTITNFLVVGGSQGSQKLYETLGEIFLENTMSAVHFYIIGGTQNNHLKSFFSQFSFVSFLDFVSQSQMGQLCQLCDVGITRGGATSLAEQKLFGMKLIIVPLPYTGGNHQYFNALYYEKKYQDILISQNDSLKTNLQKQILSLQNFKKNSLATAEIMAEISKAPAEISKALFSS
ncbi:MAG TPA: UDP-N-acetylglucosamine--N-acetylmuramyl-(pentapeptide) pyrophosphoryl-undecaprenol N-acetylglucosamine transferase [Candidatus Absconditabacterales bacterium]|nr:UDP-N-acetylglucosamine--N-acetylmuramyl-(pentapeptide) pyrophosphoryl-undecaprenol N-acetylglucosamine transferase [Candidatus Absconditabacterales bacterium]